MTSVCTFMRRPRGMPRRATRLWQSVQRGHSSCLIVAAMLYSGACLAQSPEHLAADALFRAGRDAMKQNDTAAACANFHASDDLEPAVGTWLNLALCEEVGGHWLLARGYFQRVVRELADADVRAQMAKQHIAALDTRIPTLVVQRAPGAPSSSRFEVPTHHEAPANFETPMAVDPGPVVVQVNATQHATRVYRLNLVEGQHAEISVQPGAPMVADDTAETPAHGMRGPATAIPTASRPPHPTPMHFAGLSALITGAALLATAAIAGLYVLHDKSIVQQTCHPDRTCDSQRGVDAAHQGKTMSMISKIALTSGALLSVGASVYLLAGSGTVAPSYPVARLPINGFLMSYRRSF